MAPVIQIMLRCLILISFPCAYLTALVDPPIQKYASYKAIGEIVTDLSFMTDTMQVAFEEHFDNSTGDAVLILWETGLNFTYMESGLTGQTLKYSQNKECQLEDKKDWLGIGTSIPGYGYKDGRVVFSLLQLFSLDFSALVESERGKKTNIRGIPATSWQYKMSKTEDDETITEVTITAYFSNEDWSTTSDMGVRVPLGYELEKVKRNRVTTEPIEYHDIYISVFAFILGAVDKKVFEPIANVYCPDRIHPLAFPKFPKWNAFSMKSEVIFLDNQEIKSTDIYFDSLNRMVRIDLDRTDGQEIGGDFVASRKYTTQITSKDLGASFKIDMYRKSITCKVSSIDEYNFDMQEIINPKLDNKFWSLDYIIGSNTTNYTYMGKTTRRNMPCHLFQGIRVDWPDASSKVKSLWEWCLSTDFAEETKTVRFRDGELGIISAFVNVIESANDNIMVGYRMVHHFYDIVKEDPHVLSLTQFDINQFCFKNDSQNKRLQFVVDIEITADNMLMLENATSDTTFLRLWRNAIADATNLLVSYLRISKIQASIFEKQVIVSFTLYGIHESLPEESKKGQPTLTEAQKSLQSTIDKGELTIDYIPSKNAKAISMAAKKGSLGDSVDVVREHSTTPTVTPTTPIGKDDDESPGFGPGPVAGISIGVLLSGIIAGAGGAYFKFKG